METTGYAPINGIKMYYEIYGEGKIPLVLIHGGGSTIETSFANIIPFLAKYGKVIAVELQAHGRTSDRNAPESFAQDADDVAALVKHLKIEKANFFGFSNGGSTTLQIAIRHPDVVNKIIALSAASKRDGLIAGFFEGMKGVTLANMPTPLQEAYLKVAPNKDGLKVMFEKDRDRMINFQDWKDEDMKAIKAPTLFIVSQNDVITIDHTVKMSQLITGAKLIVLPGVHGSCIGEVCTVEKGSKMPEITAALMDEFLKAN
ncbi:alpha/beta hydrolase [Pedobacter frigiditerrae]|uniref:alpha/beta fold hydrolase n=1 Tax=Pedobacter frigiditerrae TaxID=2530452 RepID=UPI00292EC79D|nr:alpha/beta hydrolase [Pedobacter frigiditerrae]